MLTSKYYPSRQRISTCLPILFFIALSFLFCFPLLKNLYISCRGDWDYFFFLYEIPSISLFEYQQFPLWNPYCGGGLPLIGNPQQGFPSPIFIITSMFGVVAGLKISVWLHTFIGLWGMWLLSEQLGIRGVARLAPPFIFMFSGSWAFHLAEGHIVWLPAAFLPLVVLAFLKGLEDRRWFAAAAIFESLMIYEGGTYVLAYSVLFLFVFAFCHSLTLGRWKPIITFAAINILAAALSAPKLFPLLDLLGSHPRVVDAGKAMAWDDFLALFIERDNNLGTSTWEYGSYVGVPVVVIYLFGIATLRKHLALVMASLFMLLVALGNFASFAPWTLLHRLPFFRNFQLPTRSLTVFCFTVALLVGLYLTRWIQKDNKWAVFMAGVVVLVIGVDLFRFSGNIFPQTTVPVQVSAFRLDGPMQPSKAAELYYVSPTATTGIGRSVASVHQPFTQISIPGFERFIHGAWSDQYLPLLQNRGVIDAYETLPFERKALSVKDKGYKGEFYLLEKGEIKLLEWSPNRLVFHVSLNKAGRLVINQNYWKGWQTSLGEITSHAGLLAIDLPVGEYDFTVKYLPSSFLLGICLFCAAVIAIIVILGRNTVLQGAGTSL